VEDMDQAGGGEDMKPSESGVMKNATSPHLSAKLRSTPISPFKSSKGAINVQEVIHAIDTCKADLGVCQTPFPAPACLSWAAAQNYNHYGHVAKGQTGEEMTLRACVF
jgi:hypothetical protein